MSEFLHTGKLSTEEFCHILGMLDLSKAGKKTAQLFGLSLRQLQRITAGKSPVPRPVALLAITYYGVRLTAPRDATPRAAPPRITTLRRAPQRNG